MTNKKKDDVKKYSNKDIEKMRTKFITRDYSDGWYRKHFLGMMGYIEWLNGKE